MYSLNTQLNVKIVKFKTIQFSLITQFNSIQLIDRILSGASTPVKVDLRVMAMKGYSTFPKAPALLKPHYQIV